MSDMQRLSPQRVIIVFGLLLLNAAAMRGQNSELAVTVAERLIVTSERNEECAVRAVEGDPEPFLLAYNCHTAGGAFDTKTDTDSFAFEGEAGDLVIAIVYTGVNGLDPAIEMYDPQGTQIAADYLLNGPGSVRVEVILRSSGVHRIATREAGGNQTGTYLLQLETRPPARAAVRLPYDTVANDEFQTQADLDYFVFNGTKGDIVRLGCWTSVNGLDPVLRMYDPQGADMGYGSYTNGPGAIVLTKTLPMTGEYLLTMEEGSHNQAGTYQIAVQCLWGAGADPILLEYGAHTVGAKISVTRADVDTYAFEGEAGDDAWIICYTPTNGLDLQLWLYAPDGEQIAYAEYVNGPGYAEITKLLPEDGTYTIVVGEGAQNQMGDYILELERIPPVFDAPSLAYGVTVSDSVSPSTDIDFYSFCGLAGAEVTVTLSTRVEGYDPVLVIYDPAGNAFASGSYLNGPGSVSVPDPVRPLPLTGRYLVLVYESVFNQVGGYTIRLNCVSGPCDEDCPIGPFVRGDANADDSTNIADSVSVLGYLFTGSGPPPCLDGADADDSGLLNLNDPIMILNVVFGLTPAFPEPFLSCGLDETGDFLTCESYPPCEGARGR